MSLFATPSWLEPVTITRSGTVAYRGNGAYDAEHRSWYLDHGADVRAGDLLGPGADGVPVVDVQRWAGAGLVVVLAPLPALPDTMQLLRSPAGRLVLDETTGALTPPSGAQVWTGPCSVEPRESDGSTPDLGEQRVGVVPFLVKVPLSLVDVRRGDVVKVTASGDARLLKRPLLVTLVRASSTEAVREVLAFDNQGGPDAG